VEKGRGTYSPGGGQSAVDIEKADGVLDRTVIEGRELGVDGGRHCELLVMLEFWRRIDCGVQEVRRRRSHTSINNSFFFFPTHSTRDPCS
jgi:hypothetical protein